MTKYVSSESDPENPFGKLIDGSFNVAKFIGGTVGLIFAGIGVTVLIFLWAAPINEFGSPPVFFRIFGSFIAAAFVAIGGGSAFAIIVGGSAAQKLVKRSVNAAYESATDEENSETIQASPANYKCPQCGAPIESGSDVSPHGDARCGFCDSWFNIHT